MTDYRIVVFYITVFLLFSIVTEDGRKVGRNVYY